MYDYMAFLLVGVVILAVGMLIGRNLAENEAREQRKTPNLNDEDASNVTVSESNTLTTTTNADNIDAKEIQRIETAFMDYREQVKTHLAETETAIDTLTAGYDKTLAHLLDSEAKTPTHELVSELTQSYQNVFSKLSDSAKHLIDDSATLQRLDARRDKAVLINTQQRVNKH